MDTTFGCTACISTTQDNQDSTLGNSLEKVPRDKRLRMKVRRRKIWSNWSNAQSQTLIKFVGEPPVNQGGPHNEWFSLLHREVYGSNIFIGSETCKLFNNNFLALEQRNYFMYGQQCSLAILQGSPAPSFLPPTLRVHCLWRTGQSPVPN